MGEKREAVRIRLLGGFRVSVGSRTIAQDAWRLKKAAALVKLLALAPGYRMHREQIMGLLWPDSGTKAASNSLRSALHAARQVLASDPTEGTRYLGSDADSLVLCPNGDLWVDVEAFEAAARSARRSREPGAYEAAIELYAGELLPEDRYEEWAEERRRALSETYASLFLGLAWAYEERGDHGSSIEVLRRVTREEPANEEAHVGLMRLYALSGRKTDALRQYESFEEIISRGPGLGPSASTRALQEEIASGRFPSEAGRPLGLPSTEATQPPQHNLPAPRTSFVGRGRELTEIQRALAMTRLLTLTGTGGSGKTRLALEVATDVAVVYPDGVWLVELAGLSEPELVPQAVAGALGVREQPSQTLVEALSAYLTDRKVLLVLDNCEHLVDTVARLADFLLASCPRLKVLATSREPLGVEGEVLFPVPSLSVPAGFPADPAEIEGHDSVRLFAERARMRLPVFALTEENAPAVSEICRRLGGIPLAIELAAARMGTLATQQVAERLEDSLALLSSGPRTVSPRHSTMRDAIGWSYGLLPEKERETFDRLAAFAGGFTLEAAEAVCPGGHIEQGEVLDLLSHLVDKSLVVAETFGEGRVRYRLLEPVRQYARERLEESGEADAIGHQHAAVYLALVETAESELRGGRQEEWLERLEAEHDNFRTALLWTLEREEVESSLRFGATLGDFWHLRGHLSEGRRWLERVLAKGDALSVTRVRALAKASSIAMEQADLERATALGEEGLKLARKLGDEEGTATALLNLGMAVMARGELERSKALLEEGLPLFRGLGDQWGLTRTLISLGFVAMFQGDDQRAKTLVEESLAVSRKSGDAWSSGMALNQLALMALLREDYGRAQALCNETLELSRRSGMQHLITIALHTSAALAGSREQPLRSARLWGAAEALREAMGTVFTPLERQTYGPYMTAARAQVEESSWEEAWQKGRAMSMEVVIDYVLSEGKSSNLPAALAVLEQPKVAKLPHVLTRREEEIATFVARGLTNRQVAQELSISEHTVATHVGKIMRKLGLRSRSRLAAWVAE